MTTGGLGDFSSYERMLYGDVENDPELEAELMAIQRELGEEDDEVAPTVQNRAAPPRPKIRARSPPIPMEEDEKADEDISDVDDPELEAELMAMQTYEVRTTDETAPIIPTKMVSPPVAQKPLQPEKTAPETGKNPVTVSSGNSPPAKPTPPDMKMDVSNSPPEKPQPKPVQAASHTGSSATKSPSGAATSPIKNPAIGTATNDPSVGTAPSTRRHLSAEESARPVQVTEEIAAEAFSEKATASAFHAPPAPSTILEALQQRLEKYKSAAEQAQQEGNASKARRMGRIQKQYEDAIKAHKTGKPVDFDELPTPPGFGPIPRTTPKQAPSTLPAPSGVPSATAKRPSPTAKAPPSQIKPGTAPANLSRQEKELRFLMERQQQFKAAALAAKKRGDLPTAKHLLKQSMGLEQMINASKNGLRVDVASIPTPPQVKTAAAVTKAVITKAPVESAVLAHGTEIVQEGAALSKAGYEEVFTMLEQDLINQIQICERNREFYLSTGDVQKVSEFERTSNGAKKDLAALRNAFKHGDPPPRFHYETRIFPSVNIFPELGVYDLELTIVRGIHVKLPTGYEPKDADIYVKYELGYPKETPQSGKTPKIKGTNSPSFDYTCLLRINPKSRQFLHMIKRIGVKLEVVQKGGFLRSDISLGNAEIKLLPLETQPLLHQSLDIFEARKPVGGKLEVKIRIREPLVQKQAEEVREKWLVIDQFLTPSKATVLVKDRAAAAAAFGSRQLGTGK